MSMSFKRIDMVKKKMIEGITSYWHCCIARCCTEKRQQSAWFARNRIVRLPYPAIIMWSARRALRLNASARTVRLQLSHQVRPESFLRILLLLKFSLLVYLKKKKKKERGGDGSRKLWKNIMWVVSRFCKDSYFYSDTVTKLRTRFLSR